MGTRATTSHSRTQLSNMGIITGNTLPITSLYGGILAIAFALTALAVGLTRAGTNVYYGSKDKTPLQYRVRANGSIGEHGIWGIAVLGLLEYNQVLGSGQLWWWGLLFTVFRLAPKNDFFASFTKGRACAAYRPPPCLRVFFHSKDSIL